MLATPIPPQVPSYGSLYESNETGGTDIVIASAGTYYQWVSATVGPEKGAGYIVGSAINNNMVVGPLGAGPYQFQLDMVYKCEAGANVVVAAFVAGSRILRLTKRAELSAGITYVADSVDVQRGTIITGDVTSTHVHDGDPDADTGYLHIQEPAGDTGTLVELTFIGPEEPKTIQFHGRYNGNAAHENESQVFDTSIGADLATNGGDTYTCIRDHNSSDADTEPGAGGQWESYWKLVGTGGSAWDNSTLYVSGFIDVRDTVKDIPNTGTTTDITREWKLPGTHAKLKDYSDNGTVRIRFIHNTQGNTNHNFYIDQVLVQDDDSNRSVSASSPVDLVAGNAIDLRVTSDTDGDELTVRSANLSVHRIDL